MIEEDSMAFIDGEDLVSRYQAMIREGGRFPSRRVAYEPDVFVWSTGLFSDHVGTLVRVTYYTSAYGSEDRLNSFRDRIQELRYASSSTTARNTSPVQARVFPRLPDSPKSRSIDVNMTIDSLRHTTYNSSIKAVHLVTGDGEFLPLIEEIQRAGTLVHVRRCLMDWTPRFAWLETPSRSWMACFSRPPVGTLQLQPSAHLFEP